MCWTYRIGARTANWNSRMFGAGDRASHQIRTNHMHLWFSMHSYYKVYPYMGTSRMSAQLHVCDVSRLIYAHFIHTAKCNQKCLAIFWIESFVARSFGKYDRKRPRQPAWMLCAHKSIWKTVNWKWRGSIDSINWWFACYSVDGNFWACIICCCNRKLATRRIIHNEVKK